MLGTVLLEIKKFTLGGSTVSVGFAYGNPTLAHLTVPYIQYILF